MCNQVLRVKVSKNGEISVFKRMNRRWDNRVDYPIIPGLQISCGAISIVEGAGNGRSTVGVNKFPIGREITVISLAGKSLYCVPSDTVQSILADPNKVIDILYYFRVQNEELYACTALAYPGFTSRCELGNGGGSTKQFLLGTKSFTVSGEWGGLNFYRSNIQPLMTREIADKVHVLALMGGSNYKFLEANVAKLAWQE